MRYLEKLPVKENKNAQTFERIVFMVLYLNKGTVFNNLYFYKIDYILNQLFNNINKQKIKKFYEF